MNWSKVKTLMVLILLSANLILAYTLISRYRNINFISTESIEMIGNILEESGVELDTSKIDRRKPAISIYEAVKSEEYQVNTATALSQSEVSGKFLSPAGTGIIMENGEKYEFGKGFSFSYIDNQDESAYYSAVYDSQGKHNSGNIGSKALADLTKIINSFMGNAPSFESDSSDASKGGMTEISAAVDVENKCYVVSVSQMLDGVIIEGNTLVFIIKQGENKVSAAKGLWSFVEITEKIPSQIYDQLNILFNEKKRADAMNFSLDYDVDFEEENDLNTNGQSRVGQDVETPDDKNIIPVNEFVNPQTEDNPSDKKIEITSLKLCYCVYQSSDGSHIFYIPGWKITRKDNSFTIYNGMNGKIYTNVE